MRLTASAVAMNWSGIGSVPGDSGPSQASVHAVRSWRAGFPVRDRERTVSRDVAFKTFSRATGWRSLSVDASQIDPVQAPSAPSASAAATCRPQPIPPAASTGVGATASTTSGTRTSVAISPVWPPASLPDAITMSTPASTWRRACSAVPMSAATSTPRSCTLSTTSRGGVPSALTSSLIGWPSATSTCERAPVCVQASSDS